MKATKKIVGAACALVAAVALSAGSTFAWFAQNNTVTATGMSVTAQAPQALMISTTSATEGFGSTVTLASDTSVADKIVPTTHTHASTTYSFFKLTAAAMATVNQNGALTGDAASAEVKDNDYYDSTSVDYFKDSVWLKLEGASGTKQLKAKVDYTNSPTQLAKTAMHVLFVNGDNGDIALDYDMSEEATSKNLVVLTSNAVATKYDIYYYLAGTDAECKNTNLTADQLLSVTITFEIVDVQA